MILAEKIITLRKKSGWSQEELAEKMNVSRQSVSKWEGAQSVPDLSKILTLSQLFGVSTDYLLKDEIEADEHPTETSEETTSGVRRVSMEEAVEFLSVKAQTAPRIALATLVCVFAPIPLIVLGAASETGSARITENAAGILGLVLLFLCAAVAVAIFIGCGMKTGRFEYLEKEPIETAYGVTGMVREKQKQYRDAYARRNITGVCVCILAVIPLLTAAFLTENELYLAIALSGTMLLAGCGAVCFISVGIPWASLQKLLQEEDYTPEKKRQSGRIGAISTAYWLVVTALYLGWSFYTNDWKGTWIVWPVAGVLFGAIMAVSGAFLKSK